MRYNVVSFCILVVAQMLICNYLHISMYLTLSLLPVLILCIPTRIDTIRAMLIAFAAGFAVDFAAEGVIGLNIAALLPVALLRRTVCDAIFGDELLARNEDFSFKKYGAAKVIFAVAIAQAVFLAVYIWADCGAARPFGENFVRGLVSFVAGILLSVPIADMLTKEERR